MVNKKELTFTLFNNGNAFNFNPFKDIICPYEKRKRSQLDFYRDFVTFHKSRHHGDGNHTNQSNSSSKTSPATD